MANGFSLHFGLNQVDKHAYKGSYRTLKNAENDAQCYQRIAASRGLTTDLYISDRATSENFINNILKLAETVTAGDLIFITYSGHGTKVPDLNNDENDLRDEALLLYDRLFLDDEFKLVCSRFVEGVRILFVNDSCYNGSATRFAISYTDKIFKDEAYPILRGIDAANVIEDFERNIAFYKTLKDSKTPIQSSIIHIGSCQDNQLSDDGSGDNGFFTSKFNTLFDKGNFIGSYKLFYERLKSVMPPWQTPNWDTAAGKKDEHYEGALFLVI
jgi:hypothetical protein